LLLGPLGWIQAANFIVLGLLLFIFSRGLADEFKGNNNTHSGITLLTIIA
jgi:hypothetical protein